jgi:ankyrin repeat protein
VEFCDAIDRHEAGIADRLTADSPVIHAVGKVGVTPLLWAASRNALVTFRRLLELGADPNVPLTEDIFDGVQLHKGDCVVFFAFGTELDGYSEAVLSHGGNPKFVRPFRHDSVLHEASACGVEGQKNRILRLLALGADPNQYNGSGKTPAMHAVSFGKFAGALTLLENGADYRLMQRKNPERLIHVLVRVETDLQRSDVKSSDDPLSLQNWLEAHGESMAAARLDVERWEKMRATLHVDEYIAERTKERESNLKNASVISGKK